jgi:N-acetylglucosaminyldiphosphoundecaprenol N-acetyl-beta-D-mannosaminyltransferase
MPQSQIAVPALAMQPPELADLTPQPNQDDRSGDWSRVGRVDISRLSINAAAREIVERALSSGGAVHLANAYSVALAQRDDQFAAVLSSGWLTLADGRPLQWLSTLRRQQPRMVQIRGADLVGAVAKAGCSHSVRHFLLGSTDEVLRAVEQQLRASHQGLEICGSVSPPFAPLTSETVDDLVAKVDSSRAQIVWVALGTPKQDFAVEHLAKRTGAVCIGVGGAFEMVAGVRRTAPQWAVKAGLEWVVRLVQEPRRLWRRYLVGNSVFLAIAVRELVREVKSR